jgi:hypothetical protein
MDTKLYDVGSIESGVPLPQRAGTALTPGQQRVLELEDGDSFLLQTARTAESNDGIPTGHFRGTSDVAARLASWARGRHVRLAYRMIDKHTARIWRRGAI